MSQGRLLDMVVSVMLTAGFEVSERCSLRPRSFDLIAGRGDVLMVLKVVSHIDSVTEEISRDLDAIARHLNASPMIVGERARDADLERGTVYVRYGIYAISPATLYDYLVDEVPPLIYAQPGGLYVNVNGDMLKGLREQHQFSLGDLARYLGVSRRTISKYEDGMNTTLEVAVQLEELFDEAVIEAIDLLSYIPAGQTDEPRAGGVPDDFERMGIEVHQMRRAPFQALALVETETIFTCYGTAQKTVKRAALIGNISQIAGAYAMCVISDYKKKKRIGRTLVVGEEHLHPLEDGSDLIDLISP
ncbi:transcriptional regulator [Methanofollis formosanus]|uniref:Putative HTH-type transcriptional regulatory protein E2N92_08815 n=1 Tax=Methanofollis formosanus TaxID=299308 RepID=A0A8G1A2I8_9EURY|nr:transcriptional regulator [Methanofollis formosanus]QYZ79523.1 transcriptional regulator [Methanofollis formosanus]